MSFWRNTSITLTEKHVVILCRLLESGGELPKSSVGWGDLWALSQLAEVGYVSLPAGASGVYCITRKGVSAASALSSDLNGVRA
jgi:hypothetical protein